MKSKVLISLCCAMMAGAIVFNVNIALQKKNKVEIMLLENIEALADDERDSTRISQYQYYPSFGEWACTVPGHEC